MNSSAISMELSVSFVSWINDQMRQQLVTEQVAQKNDRHRFVVNSAIVAASLTCITVAVVSFFQ